MTNAGTDAEVRVYWRPGCPYCARLRRDLARIGLPTREIDIWTEPDAAAVVRSVAGGNETVPTVLVGTGDDPDAAAMVNPSATEVLRAVRATAPSLLAGIDPDAATRVARGRSWGGVLLALVMAVVWFGPATAHPATTYHVAPLLVAAVWPLERRWRAGVALPIRAALTAAAGSTAVALATMLVLVLRHAVAAPGLVETLIAIGLGAGLGVVLACWPRRHATESDPGESTVDG